MMPPRGPRLDTGGPESVPVGPVAAGLDEAGSAMIGSVAEISLVYVGDPMCSWCWGFAPVLEEVVGATGVGLEVVVGGLRPGPAAEPLAGGLRRYLEREWAEIAARTGQPFDVEVLEQLGDGWVYDTEMADMAVVHMRALAPDQTLPFFVRVQSAFYAERIDVTHPDSYGPLVGEFGVDPGEFVRALGEDELRKEAWRDFATARRWGVTGFPTLLFRRGERIGLITAGYRPARDVMAAVSSLL